MSKLREPFRPVDKHLLISLMNLMILFWEHQRFSPTWVGHEFQHESHLRFTTRARKVKIPNAMPFAGKVFVIFSTSLPLTIPKMFIIKDENFVLTRRWKLWKTFSVLSSLSFCAKLMFRSEENIHHKHGSVKAYSKLNLIKHSDSALRNWMFEIHRGKSKSHLTARGGENYAPLMTSSFSLQLV